jgi:hypothetical protein
MLDVKYCTPIHCSDADIYKIVVLAKERYATVLVLLQDPSAYAPNAPQP